MTTQNWLVISFVIFGAVVVCDGTEFGRCNNTYFLTNALECDVTFYKALASDETANCSLLYKSRVVQCYNNTLFTCFQESREGWRGIIQLALLILEVMGSSQFYCSDVEINQLSRLPAQLRKLIPCNDHYLIAGQNCARRFRELLARNRKDPELCREYDHTKECTSAAAKAYCNTTFDIPAGVKEVNPFCRDEGELVPSTSKDQKSPKLALIKDESNGTTGSSVEATTSKSPRSRAGYVTSGITPIVLMWIACVLFACFSIE